MGLFETQFHKQNWVKFWLSGKKCNKVTKCLLRINRIDSIEFTLLHTSVQFTLQFSSAQFSCLVVSDSLRPHEFTACQASLSITRSWSSPKLLSIKSVMPSSHLIFCRPFLLLPPILPSIATLRHKQISSIVKVNSSFYISLLKTPTPTNS